MFIELTLSDERGKAYFDTKQISVITSSPYRGEAKVFIGGTDNCFYVEESPEEVLNKIQNAK